MSLNPTKGKPTQTKKLVEKSNLSPKEQAIQTVIGNLRKSFGEDAVFYGNDTSFLTQIPSFSTRSMRLDYTTGVGGVPRGRIIEIYGPESSGKTTLALGIIAEAQSQGEYCAIIDTEQALDSSWCERLGVDMSAVLISQPNNGEDALAIAEELIASGIFGVVVLDSVAALVPRAELNGEMGDSHMGLQARLMAQALRKMTNVIKTTNTTMIFTNQVRSTMGGGGYGPTETTTGGRALKFFASLRLEVRRIESIKGKNGVIVGNKTKIKLAKNKVGPPLSSIEVDIMFDEGLSVVGEIIDLSVELGFIAKAGAFFKDAESLETLAQGRENLREWMFANPEKTFVYHNKIRKHLSLPLLTSVPVYNRFAASGGVPAELDPPVNIDKETGVILDEEIFEPKED